MDREAVMAFLIERFRALSRAKGLPSAALSADTPLFSGAGVDSLDLATIIVELETTTGVEPFKVRVPEFRTIGELAALFAP
jgi:acyl carrier protein